VATTLLVAGYTLTFWIPWRRLCLHPPARTQQGCRQVHNL